MGTYTDLCHRCGKRAVARIVYHWTDEPERTSPPKCRDHLNESTSVWHRMVGELDTDEIPTLQVTPL